MSFRAGLLGSLSAGKLAGTSERTIRNIESCTGESVAACCGVGRTRTGTDTGARPMPRDLQRLKLIGTADVYKGGVLAGQLRRTADGGVEFANSVVYLAEPQQQVTFSLPLSKEPVLSEN